ncbi:mitochondrial fission ELM1 family protein [Chelatococcus albus]|uniref:mitochondrial fission ELM1 family protein n=1 Tax=Chelatococcus albus TaxID=3047466 RepID=UPI0030EE492F
MLTDGKAGDELQCLAVAEALGLAPEVRRVAPRAPFTWLMPYGPIDPREAPRRRESPVAPPYPDLLIASGRRAIAYVRHVKRASGGRTFTVILKDPRTGTGDFIWVSAHDRLRGPNVLATLTPPHRISAARLAAARMDPPPVLAALPPPRAAVLVGGSSRHHRFTAEDISRFTAELSCLAESGVALMATTSRRTPVALRDAIKALIARSGGYLWDGTGDNPYVALLALADSIVVTADSTNMLGEAAATGAPILVFEPSGGHRKIKALLEGLTRAGAVRTFHGRLEGGAYAPLDSTPIIAEAIATAFAAHRARLNTPPRG